MKILSELYGVVMLRLCDDKSHMVLMMDYDDQVEQFQLALRPTGEDGEVNPLPPVKRLPGEDQFIFYDRACGIAYAHYISAVQGFIERESRAQQAQHLLGQIDKILEHMILTVRHWDTTLDLSDSDLAKLYERLDALRYNDAQLSEYC